MTKESIVNAFFVPAKFNSFATLGSLPISLGESFVAFSWGGGLDPVVYVEYTVPSGI